MAPNYDRREPNDHLAVSMDLGGGADIASRIRFIERPIRAPVMLGQLQYGTQSRPLFASGSWPGPSGVTPEFQVDLSLNMLSVHGLPAQAAGQAPQRTALRGKLSSITATCVLAWR